MKWGFIMTKPEMILFDYGHTLIYEPGFNRLRGNEAILSHATRNPKGVTAEQLKNLYHEYYRQRFRSSRLVGFGTEEFEQKQACL
jgi:putative hydrolase of the HAD superfamily